MKGSLCLHDTIDPMVQGICERLVQIVEKIRPPPGALDAWPERQVIPQMGVGKE